MPSTSESDATARSALLRVSSLAGRPAIAVLPFENRSDDADQDSLALGISEDLISRLSTWRSFPVISGMRSLARTQRQEDRSDPVRIGSAMGARYLVLGGVRRSAQRVRVTAELVDAETAQQVWSERFDRQLGEIFAMQDAIARAIVESMRPELWEFDLERAVVQDPTSFEAWDWAQRAWWHLNRFAREEADTARSLFERALELDPSFVSALYGVAMSHYFDLMNGWSHDVRESIELQHRYAERAIAADERNALAHLALGCAHSVTGPNEKAVGAFALAVDLNPSSTWGAIQLGTFLALGGRPDDGIRFLETAASLDAKHPLHWSYAHGMSLVHFAAERWRRAIEYADRCLTLRPHWTLPLAILSASLHFLGRGDEARDALARLRQTRPEFPNVDDHLARALSPEIAARLREGIGGAGGG